MPIRRAAAVSLVLAMSAVDAHAQCPDGTLPPCAAVTVRPAARTAASVPAPAERARRFLILPFRNVTRGAEQEWLVEGSTTMLSDALARWQGITVVPDEKLYPALKRAGIQPGVVADATRVRRVSEETGGWTVVTGEVLATGDNVRITARAWDGPTSRELVRVSSQVPRGGDVRQAFDSVSLRLLQSVGLDSATTDLANATTRNLDAYRAYLRGLAHHRRSEVTSALPAFEEAIRRDSSFALAWARLADMLWSAEPLSILNPQSRAAQASARAVALSANLSPRQRALVQANNANFRAQFGVARTLLEGILKEDPSDVDALAALMGVEQFDPLLVSVPGGQRPRGSPAASARAAKRVVQLDPSRHVMYGALAQIYANAGFVSAQPVIGLPREPSSFSDLMQMLNRREGLRAYTSLLLGDSLTLVPIESLSVIPKDSLRAVRRAARAIGRGWGEQWLASAGDQAAPHQLMSVLLALDGEYAAALRSLARAESIGVQTPAWSAPARRLVILGRSGDLVGATRLADSLATAGFFANASLLATNSDAAIWAFTLSLARGRAGAAQTLVDQLASVRRLVSPGAANPEQTAFQIMMGSADPEDDPNIPRGLRGRLLDSVVANLPAFLAAPRMAPLLPQMLSFLADAADTTRKRVPQLLPVADSIAAKGQTFIAFSIASNAVSNDSTLEPVAAQRAWYRPAAEAYNAVKRATTARMRPASATVSAQQVVFEWKIDDSTPFPLNRAETPAGRTEFYWDVTVDLGTRYYRVWTNSPAKSSFATPSSVTLSEILPPNASRQVASGTSAGGVMKDTTRLLSVNLRTEFAPGALRLIVTDPVVVGALRSARPVQARFRFFPCVVPVGTVGRRECLDERIAITYSP